MMYVSWHIECDRQNFLSFWTIFCPFTPLTTRKIKILKNWKKKSGNIIILHMCTTNDNHMMYGSWDMKHDRQNFLSFWTVFLPFYLPNNLKNQNFEKLKKPPEDIIILHMCTINDNQMMYGSWDIEHDRKTFFVILNHSLPFYPSNNPKYQNFEKLKKTPGDIIILHIVYHKLQPYNVWLLRYRTWRAEFFVILDNFLPIYPLKTRKIKILKK